MHLKKYGSWFPGTATVPILITYLLLRVGYLTDVVTCLIAERARPRASSTYRTVAAEEKQNAERQERTAGGSSGAHQRGGAANTAAHLA